MRLSRQIPFLILLAVVCMFLSGCGKKAKTQKVYRVGILSVLDFFADTTDGFKARMTELGYVKGKNIVYDLHKMDFDMALYKSILKKFVADKVDLVFVFPTEASMEAKAAAEGTGIPVVFAIANIEGTNLVESVRQPGGNITGVRYPGPDLAAKRFEIMCELMPQAKRIWIPYQRDYPIVASQLEVLRPMAESSGVTLSEIPASNAAELETELQAIAKSVDADKDVILVISEPLAVTPDTFAVIGKFATEHKIPIGGALMVAGEYESVFGVNIDAINTGKQAAVLADKVLKGAPAGTIPAVSSESYFQLNYKAAKELGLNVPEGLLSRADEIIR